MHEAGYFSQSARRPIEVNFAKTLWEWQWNLFPVQRTQATSATYTSDELVSVGSSPTIQICPKKGTELSVKRTTDSKVSTLFCDFRHSL